MIQEALFVLAFVASVAMAAFKAFALAGGGNRGLAAALAVFFCVLTMPWWAILASERAETSPNSWVSVFIGLWCAIAIIAAGVLLGVHQLLTRAFGMTNGRAALWMIGTGLVVMAGDGLVRWLNERSTSRAGE